MRKSNNQIIFSASDLSNHIHCKHLTSLNNGVLEGLLEKPVNNNRVLDVLRERGIEFENSFLTSLENEGCSVLKINPEESDPRQKTLQAMQDGFDYIYQARLGNDQWQGWADFLVKVPLPSNLGAWSYEVIDTKLSTHTRAGTILQITLYSQLLEEVQGVLPEYMHVRTPEGETDYRVNDYISYFRLIKKRLAADLQSPNETYPEPCSHCDICNWWEHCNKRRRADDHLSFIAGMGTSQMKELKFQSVDTLDQLASLPLPLAFKPHRGSVSTFVKLREQARVQNESRLANRPVYELLDRIESTGFYNLPEPSRGDIYLDFEGDPLIEPSGLEYLFGWVFQDEYFKIWVKDLDEEKAALEQFVDFVFEKRALFPDLHVYHFAPYETIALKRMMGKYAVKENEIDILLRAGTFVDLHRILKQSLRAGVERYSLKDLEKYHGFVREMDLRKLSKIKAYYEFLLELKKFELITEEMTDAIQLYNQEDCFSTQHLHLWLENERTQLIENGENISRPFPQNVEVPESVNAHLLKIQPLYDALMEGVSFDATERNKEDEAKYLLAHMLDWYRREEKSFYWEYFRLLEIDDDEIMEEKEAISYMQFTGERVPSLSCHIDTYSFPPQEYEFRPNDNLQNQDGERAGTVVEVDEIRNLIKIKKGPSIHNVHIEKIIKYNKISSAKKAETLIRIAEWIIENSFNHDSNDYSVTRDLLRNGLPKVSAPPINETDTVKRSIDWASKLNNSFLPIQGPPGSGKSFTGSHMIFELVKKGFRIGVSALSHKVIMNLLLKVREVAAAESFDLKINYKGSSTAERSPHWNKAGNINSIVENLTGYHIIAGTSFMWADEALHNSIDYLFIDEAGQFALIDTIVVSHATRNIVLLGDHQQLKQPIQGIHPEGTEVSALEHLLECHKTIPAAKGIFLERTWRMHPDICSFDSEMFYESRLNPVDELENQRIEGNTPFQGSGLFYKMVNHTGNSNFSVEEVDGIEKIIEDLTKGDVYFFDKQNNRHLLQHKHIKIITPYNSNVFELQKRLPEIETGTVDKFQGQEAPVIIYSMASSSPEDAPRGMDFIYSPNRFNVAVSRAKAAFILVGSPKLFEPDCKSPEQIKLANPFCRFMEMATKVDTIFADM